MAALTLGPTFRFPLPALSRWRYAGGKRDARLDLLRGFAAAAMVVDRISGDSSLRTTCASTARLSDTRDADERR